MMAGWQLLGFLFSLLCSTSAEVVVGSSEQTTVVTLLDTPDKYTSNKTASFSFRSPGDQGCSCSDSTLLICNIDDTVDSDCKIKEATYFDLDDGEHSFVVCINSTVKGKTACTEYGWTIDTVPPTANVTASTPSARDTNITVDIIFTEPCTSNSTTTGEGFQCSSVDTCNLLVQGPAEVIPSSLEVVEPFLQYKLLVSLDPTMVSGNVTLKIDEAFCADAAGNKVKRGGKSNILVPYDRTNASSTLTTEIPEKFFEYNGQLRSIHATNNVDKLKFFIHFLQPVVNSSLQILSTIHVSQGKPVKGEKLDNRTFSFMVTNISERPGEIFLSFTPDSIITPQGTPVAPVLPLGVRYDPVRPAVWLSTSEARTSKDNISISIHFQKPIANFNSSNITISGGQILSFRRINVVRYAITVRAVGDILYVQIPENVAEDLSGNKNQASTLIKVWHVPDSSPPLSVATSSFGTASFLGASLASGLLAVSTAALQVSGSSPSSSLTSLPSSNLYRMLSFIQIISLSRRLMETPNEYYELAQHLQWSIPRYSFPWDRKPKPPDSRLNKTTLTYTMKRIGPTQRKEPPGNSASIPSGVIEGGLILCKPPEKNTKIGVTYPPEEEKDDEDDKDKKDDKDKDKQKDPNHLCSRGGEDDSKSKNIWKQIGNDNLPLAITTGGTLAVHCLLVLFLKSKRKGRVEKPSNYGSLTFPRIELFLLLEAITGICEASSSLIQEWKPLEILVGCIGLGVVLVAVLALLLFLLIGVTYGKLLRYEVKPDKQEGRQLLVLILGSGSKGRWTWKGRPDSIYLTMFGLLFEDLRGPIHPSLMPPETSIFKDATSKLLRSSSSYYNFMESMKRVCLGILAGGKLKNWFCKAPAITMLCISSLQLFFVILVKPFPERRVQLVNIMAVGSEVGIYALGVPLQNDKFFEKNKPVFEKLMVVLFLTGLLPMIANEVYGLYNEVKKLDDPDGNGSFSKGLKIAMSGLRSFFTTSSSPQCKAEGIENPVPKTSPKASHKSETDSTQIRKDAKSTSKDGEEHGSSPFMDNIEPLSQNPLVVAPIEVCQNVEAAATEVEEDAKSPKLKDA